MDSLLRLIPEYDLGPGEASQASQEEQQSHAGPTAYSLGGQAGREAYCQTTFSLNRPIGPSQSISRDVRNYVVVCLSPSVTPKQRGMETNSQRGSS